MGEAIKKEDAPVPFKPASVPILITKTKADGSVEYINTDSSRVRFGSPSPEMFAVALKARDEGKDPIAECSKWQKEQNAKRDAPKMPDHVIAQVKEQNGEGNHRQEAAMLLTKYAYLKCYLFAGKNMNELAPEDLLMASDIIKSDGTLRSAEEWIAVYNG